jgi:hypothetical protein
MRCGNSGRARPADALGVKQELERRWRRTASQQNNRPRERHGDNMTGTAQRETPQVGIFWLVQTSDGEARLLAAGCPLDQAEPYGDCLTYGPGHYETWDHWRRDRTVDPALRALVRAQWNGRSMSALPGQFRRQLVPLWQGHYRPRCRGTGRCFRSLCARAGAAWRVDCRYAGRSRSPWSVVASGYRKGVGLGRCFQSIRRQAARIASP